jgi:hypothetical protein
MLASFLIEMDENLWAGAATFADLAVIISRGPLPGNAAAPEDVSLHYTPPNSEYMEVYPACQAIISHLNAGLLTPEQALSVAVPVRRFKHVNPLFGVIAAYLYDAAGDRDSIRRITSFYSERNQPVPFDVALLAGVPGRRGRDGRIRVDLPAVAAREPRTAEEERQRGYFRGFPAMNDVAVAGGFPWMRRGWSLLDLARLPVHPELTSLAGHVGTSPFTTLDRDGGRRLATLIKQGKI